MKKERNWPVPRWNGIGKCGHSATTTTCPFIVGDIFWGQTIFRAGCFVTPFFWFWVFVCVLFKTNGSNKSNIKNAWITIITSSIDVIRHDFDSYCCHSSRFRANVQCTCTYGKAPDQTGCRIERFPHHSHANKIDAFHSGLKSEIEWNSTHFYRVSERYELLQGKQHSQTENAR